MKKNQFYTRSKKKNASMWAKSDTGSAPWAPISRPLKPTLAHQTGVQQTATEELALL